MSRLDTNQPILTSGYWFLVLCKYEYIITHRSNELEDLTFTGGVDPITGDESDTGAIAIHHYNLV